MGAGALQHGAAQRGEGASVGAAGADHALDDAVFIAAHGEIHFKMMPLGVYQNGLGAAQLDLYRPLGVPGQQRAVVLHGHILLAAEAAAHQLVLHPDLVVGQAQHQGALVQRGVGGLVGGQQQNAAVRLGLAHRALRLQEGVLGPGCLEVVAGDIFGIGHRCLGVAPVHLPVGLYIVLLLVVDPGRVRRGGLLNVVDGGEHLVIHLHQLSGLLQRLAGFRGDEGHGVAQIVDQTAHGNERVLIVLQVPDLVFTGNVRRRQHAHNALHRLGGGNVDGAYPGAGIGGANRRAVEHSVKIDIVGIFAVAQHLFLHVQPVHRRAELPVVGGVGGNDAAAQYLRRQLHGGDDLDVAGAAADVVAQGKADFVLRRVRRDVQQRLGAQHHARNAEAALDGPSLAEGVGVGLLLKFGQALYGQDGFSLQLVRHGDAGALGLAVNEDGAGAAGTFTAAVLHRGQAERIAQVAHELLVFLNCYSLAVDLKCCHDVPPPGR